VGNLGLWFSLKETKTLTEMDNSITSKDDVRKQVCNTIANQHSWCATTCLPPTSRDTPIFHYAFCAVDRFTVLPELQDATTICLSPLRRVVTDLLLNETVIQQVKVLELIPGMHGQYSEITKVDGEVKSVSVLDPLETAVDIFVVGSMGVDKKGHRVGKEGDLTGIDFILSNMGSSVKYVVTIVHDCQVFDEIPTNILSKYDLPVDIIITPSRVIKVENKLGKPSNPFWSSLKRELIGKNYNLKPAKDRYVDKIQRSELKSLETNLNTSVDGVGFVDTYVEEVNVSKDVFHERDEANVEDEEHIEKKRVEEPPRPRVKRNQMNMASKFKLDNIPSFVGYPELKEKLRSFGALPGFCVVTLRCGSAVVAFKEKGEVLLDKIKEGLEFGNRKVKIEEVDIVHEPKTNVKGDIVNKKKEMEKIRARIIFENFQKLQEQNFAGVYLGRLPVGISEGAIRNALEAQNLIPVSLEMGYRDRFAVAFFDEKIEDLLSCLRGLSINGKKVQVKKYQPRTQ